MCQVGRTNTANSPSRFIIIYSSTMVVFLISGKDYLRRLLNEHVSLHLLTPVQLKEFQCRKISVCEWINGVKDRLLSDGDLICDRDHVFILQSQTFYLNTDVPRPLTLVVSCTVLSLCLK